MTASERACFTNLVTALTLRKPIWIPIPGPQQTALNHPADLLLYGGAAGGGKTDLALGLALLRHRRSIIFRRDYGQLRAIIDRLTDVLGGTKGYNSQKRIWHLSGDLAGRSIEFGACHLIGDERRFQGRAHDLKIFDEITHFTEAQFRYLCGWLRSAQPDQRCRILCTGNPPTDPAGNWILNFWGAWLDPQHPHPAEAGEIRYYAMLDGEEVERPYAAPFKYRGEWITPQSRSFIPSSVEDNPYLLESGYKATLQALPEPLRSQMLNGHFAASLQEDDDWQVIPRAWVQAAQNRWQAEGGADRPCTMLGVDVARGGRDRFVLIPNHQGWIGTPIIHPGEETPDGSKGAALVAQYMRAETVAAVDIIGPGNSVVDHLTVLGLACLPINGAERCEARTRDGRLGFANLRACLWWRLREALEPDQDSLPLALPPGREILADLTAPRWILTPRGIQIEAKTEIRKRLGRSPDIGDAIAYALADRALSQPRIRRL